MQLMLIAFYGVGVALVVALFGGIVLKATSRQQASGSAHAPAEEKGLRARGA